MKCITITSYVLLNAFCFIKLILIKSRKFSFAIIYLFPHLLYNIIEIPLNEILGKSFSGNYFSKRIDNDKKSHESSNRRY